MDIDNNAMTNYQQGLYPKSNIIRNQNNIRTNQDCFFKDIVSFSHIIGSISSILVDYIKSAYPDNYIKTTWNTMEEPFSQRSKKFRDILAKPRPIMTIEPKFDPSENSMFLPQDEFDMYISNDPTDNIWTIERNSEPLIKGKNFILYHKLRRFRMDFNINFIFDSDMQRIQSQEYARMNIRHKVPIKIHRYIENNIPDSVINLISKITGISDDFKNHGFYRYLNERCANGGTITRRLRTGTGNMEYFHIQYTPIDIFFNDNPTTNGPVKRGNLIISSSFNENVTVEFVMDTMFIIRTSTDINKMIMDIKNNENKNPRYDEMRRDNDQMTPNGVIKHLYDIFTYPQIPEIENKCIKIMSITLQAEKNGTEKANLFNYFNGEIGNIIFSYKNNNKSIDFFHISVIEDEEYLDGSRIIFDPETFDITIKDMDITKTYFVTIYIDKDKLSSEQIEKFKTDDFDYKGGK